MSSPVYRFGEFWLDPAIRELWRGDEEVQLPPKAFGCLVYLVEHRERAVGRDELISAVWGKTELANSVLGQAVIDARHALGDTGEEQDHIKTVRGFGYRWVAPVEVGTADEIVKAVERRPVWRWAVLAFLGVSVLVMGAVYLWQDRDAAAVDELVWHGSGGEIGLLLPVRVEADERHRWIRFGAMELIADRLRAAGQPMVPSETVIALARSVPDEPGPNDVEGITSTTGARLVLEARAESVADGWRVSVRNVNEELTVFAEADDVLEAARTAADRVILSLGMTPPPESETESELAVLLQQIEAARLAQQMDLARSLIEAAEPGLRDHPEVRFHLARLDYYISDFEPARNRFENLLEEVPPESDRALRARILNGLGVVHIGRADYDAAEVVLREAARLLDNDDPLGILGRNQNSLGVIALSRGNFDLALEHMARARKAFEAIGDVRGLGMLDNNLGVLEVLHDRYAAAWLYFERAAEARGSLQDIGEELRVRSNLVHAHLDMLDPQAALEVEPRVRELINQTANPEIIVYGNLSRIAVLFANGRLQEAKLILDETLIAVEDHDGLFQERIAVFTWYAEELERDGELARAASEAAEVVDQMLSQNSFLLSSHLGRAWLLVLRAHLREGDFQAAGEITVAMEDWAARSPVPAPKIYAALAGALVAVAEGRAAAADFERALALADPGQAPRRFLQVAEPYVAWLVSECAGTNPGPERALVIADRVARYADRDYGAALLQLRVYHALGPLAAWQTALERVRALAGEREIPPELLVPPETR